MKREIARELMAAAQAYREDSRRHKATNYHCIYAYALCFANEN